MGKLKKGMFIISVIFVFALLGGLMYKCMQVEQKAQYTQQLLDELDKKMDAYAELKEDALEAYDNGYDFYLNGILVDNKVVLIDSLLECYCIVSINHVDRYVELKER